MIALAADSFGGICMMNNSVTPFNHFGEVAKFEAFRVDADQLYYGLYLPNVVEARPPLVVFLNGLTQKVANISLRVVA